MGFGRRQIVLALCSVGTFLMSNAARAQGTAPPSDAGASPGQHEHMQMNMPMNNGWQFMQDGIVFANFNHQGGPRGGDEFVAPNWWMGMASRDFSRGRLTFTGMLSLDPATVGKDGYREIFQVGEALNGRPLIDRQHPHDLFMQLAAVWRTPVTESTGFTLAGGPVGEPALGPVAFMHRASAADNPTAPLSHHLRLHTHRLRRRDGRRGSRAIRDRGLGVQRPRAGRKPLGLRFRSPRLVLRPPLVPAERRVGIAGVERPPQEPRGGARQHRALDRVRVMDAKERRRDLIGDGRLRPQRHRSRCSPGFLRRRFASCRHEHGIVRTL